MNLDEACSIVLALRCEIGIDALAGWPSSSTEKAQKRDCALYLLAIEPREAQNPESGRAR